ncbi:hypothetical protein SELMODRAFT_126354 [Selaginella moellendorffii]|uniref:Pentacotripeptide-repeat region of PRORP domain-containing protein n=1 Tax=Selaginella moellendorffii TaxID=88036 RepID=D8SW50_SELML|nr:hypothetical protein SELMODRAFT_126354 [Selaginella moellendorffii]
MYGKCGSIADAKAAFDQIHRKNVFSWTIMLGAFADCGHHRQAIEIYHAMVLEGVRPDCVAFASIAGICSELQCFQAGKAIHDCIHARAVELGLESDLLVANSLIGMYGKCYCVGDAKRLFDGLNAKNRDVISWNSNIAAYILAGMSSQALELFRERMDVEPDRITFIALIDACSTLCDLEQGRWIHERIRSSEFVREVAVENGLLLMYAQVGSIEEAMAIFESMEGRRTISSWNSMITAWASQGDRDGSSSEEVLRIYNRMSLEGLKADKITFVSLVTICKDFLHGRRIFEQRIVLETEMELATSLVII